MSVVTEIADMSSILHTKINSSGLKKEEKNRLKFKLFNMPLLAKYIVDDTECNDDLLRLYLNDQPPIMNQGEDYLHDEPKTPVNKSKNISLEDLCKKKFAYDHTKDMPDGSFPRNTTQKSLTTTNVKINESLVLIEWNFDLELNHEEKALRVKDCFSYYYEIAKDIYPVVRKEIETLHPIFHIMVMTPINKALIDLQVCLSIGASPLTKSDPDFVCNSHIDERLFSIGKDNINAIDGYPFVVGELKLSSKFFIPWRFNIVDIYNAPEFHQQKNVSNYSQDLKKKVKCLINQTYNYILENDYVMFAIISTIEQTWIMKKGCDENEVFISQCFTKENIILPIVTTLLRGKELYQNSNEEELLFASKCSIDNNNYANKKSNNDSNNSSHTLNNSKNNDNNNNNNNKNNKKSDCNDKQIKKNMSVQSPHKIKELFSLILIENNNNIHFIHKLKVIVMISNFCYIAKLNNDSSELIVVKTTSSLKKRALHDQLVNEGQIYLLLQQLQGVCIPLVLYHDWIGYSSYGLITTYCGKSFEDIGIENISLENRILAFNVLKDIHSLKVLHGDIALRNILLSDDKQNVSIIDFGLSTLCLEESDLLKEEYEMKCKLEL